MPEEDKRGEIVNKHQRRNPVIAERGSSDSKEDSFGSSATKNYLDEIESWSRYEFSMLFLTHITCDDEARSNV